MTENRISRKRSKYSVLMLYSLVFEHVFNIIICRKFIYSQWFIEVWFNLKLQALPDLCSAKIESVVLYIFPAMLTPSPLNPAGAQNGKSFICKYFLFICLYTFVIPWWSFIVANYKRNPIFNNNFSLPKCSTNRISVNYFSWKVIHLTDLLFVFAKNKKNRNKTKNRIWVCPNGFHLFTPFPMVPGAEPRKEGRLHLQQVMANIDSLRIQNNSDI